MQKQHCILETVSSPEGLVRLRRLIAEQRFPSRTALARGACREFGFHDTLQRLQVASCLKALRVLDRRRCIQLPPPLPRGAAGAPRRLGHPVAPPVDVPARVADIQGLALELVETDAQRRTWNELVAGEHPRGAACHVGAQLRYLAVSDHGILGAVGFAASALALADRDRWIGWDDTLRRSQLHRVLGLSRFLVRPSVQCPNLASKVLALCLRRLPTDFRLRYGYAPLLLETFVDSESHDGACFAAANWTRVGWTAGRGRFAPAGASVAVKAIFVYPLQADWREQLGTPEPRPEPLPARDPGTGLDRASWAASEFGGAPLGDVRWSRRLVQCAAVQADAPRASFLSAAQGDRAMVKAYYRLIDQPATSEITPENILAPHRERTLQRMQGQRRVLCLQDGTDLNFAEHAGCVGLGLIGKNANAKGTYGVHMHSTLALSAEGIPLGVPLIQYETPDGQAQKNKPHAERKTQRWVRGLRDCAAMAKRLDGVELVSVMDREADVFDLFAEQRRLGTVQLLVRAKHNRSLGRRGPKLFDAVRAARAQAWLEIHVRRSSARRGTRQQAESALREERAARVALRWRKVRLPVPDSSASKGQEPLELDLVHVFEEEPPPGAEPLEWFLLTSLPVRNRAQAEEILQLYRLRWRIEEWHRVLKSGCKVEYLAHRREERIERAVTINAVIAWRLMALTLLGRETPELPADCLFSEIEILALSAFARERGLAQPDNLGRAVRTMAMLGGYLGRAKDGPPGNEIIWEGYTRLAITVQGYARLFDLVPDLNPHHQLRPDKTTG